MISVSIDGEKKDAGEPAREIGAKFPVVWDGTGEVAKLYGVASIPLNVVIDREGVVDQVIPGANSDALKSAAERLAQPKT